MMPKIKQIQALTLVVMLTVLNASPVMALPASGDQQHNNNEPSKPNSSPAPLPDSDIQQSSYHTPLPSQTGASPNLQSTDVADANGKTIEMFNKWLYPLIATLATFFFLLLIGFIICFRRVAEAQRDVKRLKAEIHKVISVKKTENSILKQEVAASSSIMQRLELMEDKYKILLERMDALEFKLSELLTTLTDISTKKSASLEVLPMVGLNPASEVQKKPTKLTDDEIVRRIFGKIQTYIQSPEKQNTTGKQAQEAIKQLLGKAVTEVLPLNSSLDQLTLSKHYEALRVDLNSVFLPLDCGANSLLFVRQDALQDTKLSLLFDGLPLGGCVKDLHSPARLKLDANQVGQVCNITESMAVTKGQVSTI